MKLPKKALSGLQKIAALGEASFSGFVKVLGDMKPSLKREEFAGTVAKELGVPGSDDIDSILNTLFFLYRVKDHKGLSPAELADLVDQSIEDSDLKGAPGTRSCLQERIKRLVDFDKSLGITAKALDVLTEHERCFCAARILSDIRPVFAPSPDSPAAAVITHILQIRFHRNGQHEEFYVALDNEDLAQLKQVISRAEMKAKALRGLLESSHLPYVGE
jgi:hypothetical protein